MERLLETGLDFEKYPEGLMPAIVQDITTGQVMMQGFVNQQALDETRKTGLATFWSRSRNELWTKGKTSGDTLSIVEIQTDCDQDTLLYIVNIDGSGACMVPGESTCFYKEIDLETGALRKKLQNTLAWSRVFVEEEAMIQGRQNADPEKSGTAKALSGSIARIAQKFGEEAVEVVCAFTDPEQGQDRIVSEVADLMYRLQIALVKEGIPWEQIENEIVIRREPESTRITNKEIALLVPRFFQNLLGLQNAKRDLKELKEGKDTAMLSILLGIIDVSECKKSLTFIRKDLSVLKNVITLNDVQSFADEMGVEFCINDKNSSLQESLRIILKN